jgi:hypothetical protein
MAGVACGAQPRKVAVRRVVAANRSDWGVRQALRTKLVYDPPLSLRRCRTACNDMRFCDVSYEIFQLSRIISLLHNTLVPFPGKQQARCLRAFFRSDMLSREFDRIPPRTRPSSVLPAAAPAVVVYAGRQPGLHRMFQPCLDIGTIGP